MKLTLTIALSLAVAASIFSQALSTQAGAASQQQVREASVPPQDMTIEEQEDAPVRVILSAAWTVPEHKHLVELEFVAQDVSAQPIKAYTIHARETWQDAQSGNGVINHDMRYPVPAPNPEAHRIAFRAHTYGKVRVWVSSVEYADGSIWKSKLAEVGKESKKPV